MKMRIKPLTRGLLMLRSGGIKALAVSETMSKPPQQDKPEYGICLNCGLPKQHNNAFCSGDCCRAWRNKQ